MRKRMGAVLAAVVGLGLPVGAWAAGSQMVTPGQAGAKRAPQGAQGVQLPQPGPVPEVQGTGRMSQSQGSRGVSGQSAQAQGAGTASGMTTIDQSELNYLHQRIGQLEQQNAQLRAELQRANPGQTGVGGSGGAAATARAVLVGTVQQVSPQQVQVVDRFGSVYNLKIAPETEAMMRGQPVPLDRIRQGENVRARFDLVNGATVARRLEILPKQPAPQPQARPQPPPAQPRR